MEFETSLEIKELKKYRFLLPYVLLGLMILFGVNIFQTRLKKVNSLRQTIADKKEAVKRLQSRVDQIESISAAEVEGRTETVLYALPQTKDPTLILSTAKGLAVQNNLLIEEITFSPGKIALQGNPGKATKVEKVAVNFQLSGKIADLIKFLNQMSDITPLMRSRSFSIEWPKGKNPAFTVSAATFYSYANEADLAKKTEVTLSVQEDRIYQTLLGLEKIGQGVVVSQEDFQPADGTRDPFQASVSPTLQPTPTTTVVPTSPTTTPEQ